MSTQSKIDEIQKDGVYVNTNCDRERSGHSPIVVCRNKQNELNELYRALEQEQAVQRRLKEQEVAAKAIKAGIEKVVFDRNGYLYHGRVKSLADSAREGGLKF